MTPTTKTTIAARENVKKSVAASSGRKAAAATRAATGSRAEHVRWVANTIAIAESRPTPFQYVIGYDSRWSSTLGAISKTSGSTRDRSPAMHTKVAPPAIP